MPSISTTFTTFANVTRSGSIASWSNPSNAESVDASYATCGTLTTPGYTDYLEATGLASTVPDGATITGIVVTVTRKDADGSTKDSSVELIVGGSLSGSNKANTSATWPESDSGANYGASNDMWLNTLTPSMVNASNFGVAISVESGAVEEAP